MVSRMYSKTDNNPIVDNQVFQEMVATEKSYNQFYNKQVAPKNDEAR